MKFIVLTLAVFSISLSSFGQSCGLRFKNIKFPPRKLETQINFSLLSFNLENYAVPSHGTTLANKDGMLALHFQDSNPDFAVVVEVAESFPLQQFSDNYLNGAYRALLIPGNDSRIHVAFMIKKDIDVHIRMETHKSITWTNPQTGHVEALFTRDLPALKIYRTSDNPKDPNTRPLLIILATHFKSMRQSPGALTTDVVRKAQSDETQKIVSHYEQQFGNNVPIILAGDFNNDVLQAPEFSNLRSIMQDAFEVAKLAPPKSEQGTHVYFPPNSTTPDIRPLDGVYVNKVLQNRVLETRVNHHKDINGNTLPIPQNFHQREQTYPSDHFSRLTIIQSSGLW